MIRRLIDKLLYVEDAPFSDMGRRWRWGPSVDYADGTLWLGIALYLVQWEDKPQPPMPVRWAHIQLRPFEWKFGQDHTYYDGPHCCYKFGPVWFDKSWIWCDKCAEESGV